MEHRYSTPRAGISASISPSFTFRLFLLTALTAAALVATAIVLLNQFSDMRRRDEISLIRLLRIPDRIEALQSNALASKAVRIDIRTSVNKALADSHETVMKLHHADPDSPQMRRIVTGLSRYEQSVRTVMELIAHGRMEQAQHLDDRQEEARYNELSRDIEIANRVYAREADRANWIANVGAVLSLLSGAPLVAGLFVLYKRTHDRAILGEQHEAHLSSLIRNASDIICVLDPSGEIRYLSPAALPILGYEPARMKGQSVFDLVHPDDRARASNLFEQVVARSGSATAEWRMQHADGTWHFIEAIMNNLLDDANVAGVLVTYRNITDRKRFEEQLTHQAFHDSLTGLPNRALCTDRLKQAIVRARARDTSVAVLFLDVDNFKVINDSLGHDGGDDLLVALAGHLQAVVRPEDTVARLGGDEFIILLEGLRGIDEASQVAADILARLQWPIPTAKREVFVTASIGIAVCSSAGCDADTLLRDADTAMYEAKTDGKAGYVVFDSTMNLRLLERLELETDLRQAFEAQEFRVHYQPIVDLDTHRLTGVEALVRWEHPQRGLLAPGKFISIAEENGLIVPLGEWVLQQACAQAVAWAAQYPMYPPLIMNVNLSIRQLQNPLLVEEVARVLQTTGMPPSQLKLEITESTLIVNIEETADRLRQLKALGVQIAIDDFGTGFSSMAYLTSLPIDTLKIDRSFVIRLGQSDENEVVVRAIITLAKSLNLTVVSEGIESDSQSIQLQALGSDFGQGFYYARPLTAAAMEPLLAARISRGDIVPAAEISAAALALWV